VIINVNLFIVPAEFVSEGCSQSARSDNGDPTCIQIKIQHEVACPPVADFPSFCFVVVGIFLSGIPK